MKNILIPFALATSMLASVFADAHPGDRDGLCSAGACPVAAGSYMTTGIAAREGDWREAGQAAHAASQADPSNRGLRADAILYNVISGNIFAVEQTTRSEISEASPQAVARIAAASMAAAKGDRASVLNLTRRPAGGDSAMDRFIDLAFKNLRWEMSEPRLKPQDVSGRFCHAVYPALDAYDAMTARVGGTNDDAAYRTLLGQRPLVIRFAKSLCLAAMPHLATPRTDLAQLSLNEGHPQDAIDLVATIPLNIGANGIYAAILHAQALEQLGRKDEALALLYRAIAEGPKTPDVAPMRLQMASVKGLILSRADEFGKAAEAFTQALTEMPKGKSDIIARTYMYRGQAWENLNRHRRAEADYQAAIESAVTPETLAEGCNHLGLLLLDAGRVDEGSALLELAFNKVDGAVLHYFDGKVWASVIQGDVEQASAFYEVLTSAPGAMADPELNYHMGVVYQATGRRAEAAQQFRRAVEAAAGLTHPTLRQTRAAADADNRLKNALTARAPQVQ